MRRRAAVNSHKCTTAPSGLSLRVYNSNQTDMAFVNVSVNIVAEYSGLCEEVAQEFLEQFDAINTLLAQHGIPATIEPDYALDWSPADEQRQFVSKFRVENMRGLQHVYATACKGSLTSSSEENCASGNVDVSQASSPDLRYSHLVCHPDSEGVYIPNELVTRPLIASETHPGLHVMGGIVGSSYGLLDELIEVAPHLGISLDDDGSLPLHEAQRLYHVSTSGKGDHHDEICAWLALHEAAELSITYGTSIVMVPSTI